MGSTKETERPAPLISVVDDDAAMASALRRLLRTAGWHVRCYDSGAAFLRGVDPNVPGCVLLDVRMPEAGGFRVMSQFLSRDLAQPVILISGYPDVRNAIRAVRSGAVDFLPKPFDPNELFDAVERAVALDSELRREHADRAEIRARLAKLTDREREVLPLLLQGRLNKQIGYDLGISQRTVEVHRHRILKKMRADSVVELLSLAYRAGDDSVPPVFRRAASAASGLGTESARRRPATRARAASASQEPAREGRAAP